MYDIQLLGGCTPWWVQLYPTLLQYPFSIPYIYIWYVIYIYSTYCTLFLFNILACIILLIIILPSACIRKNWWCCKKVDQKSHRTHGRPSYGIWEGPVFLRDFEYFKFKYSKCRCVLLNSNNPGKMENARTGAISDVGNPESDFCDRYRAGQEVSSHFAGFNLQLINEKAHRQWNGGTIVDSKTEVCMLPSKARLTLRFPYKCQPTTY